MLVPSYSAIMSDGPSFPTSYSVTPTSRFLAGRISDGHTKHQGNGSKAHPRTESHFPAEGAPRYGIRQQRMRAGTGLCVRVLEGIELYVNVNVNVNVNVASKYSGLRYGIPPTCLARRLTQDESSRTTQPPTVRVGSEGGWDFKEASAFT